MVVIGNPPYNVGQKNENDNNKNRSYPIMEKRIRETYVKDSKATNRNALSDAYVKFFRWATDRLEGRDGIVCFVSNNSFLNGIAFDGFRKALLKDFTLIYHLDLKGDARTTGKSRKAAGGNIFDDKIRTGIGITLLIRSQHHSEKKVLHQSAGDFWTAKQKREFLRSYQDISKISWEPLIIDFQNNWLVKNLPSEFNNFIAMGTKEAKAARSVEIGGVETKTIFKVYSRGAETTRDSWMYDFNASNLAAKAENMIETYNSELSRWIRSGAPKDIDNFVQSDEKKIKWSSRLKECFARRVDAKFSTSSIRNALYRAYTRQFLYFDNIMTHRQGVFPIAFPTPSTEEENIIVAVSDHGHRSPFSTLVTNIIPDLHLMASDSFQCFPFYIYSEDGNNRHENITDWALASFQAKYGTQLIKWDIFHYVYALLHHPIYREAYAGNLKRDLPRIPLLATRTTFETCVGIGKRLMDLHLHYEEVQEYPLNWVENKNVSINWRVEKMKLSPDKSALKVNDWLMLADIPQQCYQYRLGNRSALEWVIDQYQVSTDSRSGIVSDPNREDEEQYIVHLVGKVITVSVETVKLVEELAQQVKQEEWMKEQVEVTE